MAYRPVMSYVQQGLSRFPTCNHNHSISNVEGVSSDLG